MRRACLLAVVLTVTCAAGVPAGAAPRKYAVGADLQGAMTARFTLRRPVHWLLEMTASRPVDHGMILTRVGDATSFFAGMHVQVGGTRAGGYIGIGPVPSSDTPLTWQPGTYDLTLFATSRTRVSLFFHDPMPRMTFRSRTLALARRDSSSTAPAWFDQVDVTVSGPTHGLAVFQQAAWNGMDRYMLEACAWHTVPCVPVDEWQFIDGNNTNGPHLVESMQARNGPVFTDGTNHVSIASVLGGTATGRTAVVLVIP